MKVEQKRTRETVRQCQLPSGVYPVICPPLCVNAKFTGCNVTELTGTFKWMFTVNRFRRKVKEIAKASPGSWVSKERRVNILETTQSREQSSSCFERNVV